MRFADFQRHTGLTTRRIHYWADHGLFGTNHIAPGCGARRHYTTTDVAVARTVAAITDVLPVRHGGIPIEIAKLIANLVRRRIDHQLTARYLILDDAGDPYLADTPHSDRPAALIVDLHTAIDHRLGDTPRHTTEATSA